MKIYQVVIWWPGEGAEVEAMYSTYEKAAEHRDRLESENTWYGRSFEVEEREVIE